MLTDSPVVAGLLPKQLADMVSAVPPPLPLQTARLAIPFRR